MKHSTELLYCPELRGNKVYNWSVEVIRICHVTWIGVVCIRNQKGDTYQIDRNSWLGSQENVWIYGSNGSISNNSLLFPKFDEGSIIRFKLDLRESGVLTARLGSNRGKEFTLFQNMLMDGNDKVQRSFVPAVSLKKPGSIRFLGFD